MGLCTSLSLKLALLHLLAFLFPFHDFHVIGVGTQCTFFVLFCMYECPCTCTKLARVVFLIILILHDDDYNMVY